MVPAFFQFVSDDLKISIGRRHRYNAIAYASYMLALIAFTIFYFSSTRLGVCEIICVYIQHIHSTNDKFKTTRQTRQTEIIVFAKKPLQFVPPT